MYNLSPIFPCHTMEGLVLLCTTPGNRLLFPSSSCALFCLKMATKARPPWTGPMKTPSSLKQSSTKSR